MDFNADNKSFIIGRISNGVTFNSRSMHEAVILLRMYSAYSKGDWDICGGC
jgi:hypothetical protein